MKMMAVPYAECKESFGTYYGTPSRESWSYSALPCEVDDATTADDLFEEFDQAIAKAKADEDEDNLCDWIQLYRHKVDGFALVKPEIVAMVEDVKADVCSDGASNAIAHFQVAFCVKYADRLVAVTK